MYSVGNRELTSGRTYFTANLWRLVVRVPTNVWTNERRGEMDECRLKRIEEKTQTEINGTGYGNHANVKSLRANVKLIRLWIRTHRHGYGYLQTQTFACHRARRGIEREREKHKRKQQKWWLNCKISIFTDDIGRGSWEGFTAFFIFFFFCHMLFLFFLFDSLLRENMKSY